VQDEPFRVHFNVGRRYCVWAGLRSSMKRGQKWATRCSPVRNGMQGSILRLTGLGERLAQTVGQEFRMSWREPVLQLQVTLQIDRGDVVAADEGLEIVIGRAASSGRQKAICSSCALSRMRAYARRSPAPDARFHLASRRRERSSAAAKFSSSRCSQARSFLRLNARLLHEFPHGFPEVDDGRFMGGKRSR